MSITKSKNKKTGIVYVFESHSYWDKEKKAPRNTKKLIGKIDPETGEIVPTRKRGEKAKAPNLENGTDYRSLYENAVKDIEKKDEEIKRLRQEMASLLSSEESSLKQAMDALKVHAARISTAARKYSD